MSVSTLLPTAYFVTPKNKQLAKSNSTGLVVNNINNDYQPITMSIGLIRPSNSGVLSVVSGYNGKLFPNSYTTTYFSPNSIYQTIPAWVNDGEMSYTTQMSALYGALSTTNVIIDGKATTILCINFASVTTSGSLYGEGGLHTLTIVLDKFVGDQIMVMYKGKFFALTCEYALKANDGKYGFMYISVETISGGYLDIIGYENPTGNITLYINKFSKLMFRNPEAALPAILGGPYTPGAPWSAT